MNLRAFIWYFVILLVQFSGSSAEVKRGWYSSLANPNINIYDRLSNNFNTQNVFQMAKNHFEHSQCGYKACDLGKGGMLNVHLVPHTHDDVGWLKTIDQYYYGAHNEIQHAGVQYILDTVVDELRKDSRKRMIYVEIAFFYRWWEEQHDSFRHIVKGLVNQGRLEFILGGWCMNDEASTHYNAIIDQHTVGFRFLQRNFGECGRPKIGWQIDPFGHSREQASLFAQFGFDGLFFGRLDYQDKEKRLKDKTMEHMWMASNNLGDASALFTGVNYNGYGPPTGFCFDRGCSDPPIMDNPDLADYNVNERVNDFIKAVKEQANHYTTNHIMMTMGSDFQFENAHQNYKNLDKLIKYVNQLQSNGSKVNLLYSTPSCYLYALHQANQTYTTKSDDFFPYASRAHTFWTGYFSSRPSLKGYVRSTNNLLQVCKQLDVLSNLGPEYGSAIKLDILRQALATAQHHDAVSGTEKQAVAYDYAERLTKGISACEDVINYAYKKLLERPSGPASSKQNFCHLLNVSYCPISEQSANFTVLIYNPVARKTTYWAQIPVTAKAYRVLDNNLSPVQSQLVPLSSQTVKIPDHNGSQATANLVFETVLPPLGYSTYYIIRTSDKADSAGAPYDLEAEIANISSVCLSWKYNQILDGSDDVLFLVHYQTETDPEQQIAVARNQQICLNNLVPGETYVIYVVSYNEVGVSGESTQIRIQLPEQYSLTDEKYLINEHTRNIIIENEHLRLTFSQSTGLLISMTDLKSMTKVSVNQNLLYYKSFTGNNSKPEWQASGAYIFRPNGTHPVPITQKVNVKVIQGNLVQEVRQTYSEWASQTVRLYRGAKYAEFEWTIGPIPISDGSGKEVISEFSSDLESDSEFYTDSNGREILKRVRDFRPTWKLNQTEAVAGNYYPVNSRIFIRDEKKNIQLTILTDRSQGGASVHDGQLELMLHRRILVDDAFGVGEPLNETGINGKGLVVRGKHYVLLSAISDAASLHRDMAEHLFMAPLLSFATLEETVTKYKAAYNAEWSGLSAPLPPNVHLLTLEEWEANSFLLRLEHFYEKDDDPALSKPAVVNLKGLFPSFNITSIVELTLGANQKLTDAHRLQWNVDGHGRTTGDMTRFVVQVDQATLAVTLKPMQIRTFQVFY